MADTNSLIAQSIANLSKLFAPPSGSEYYAYAQAGKLRGEQERLKAGRAEIMRIYGPEAAALFDAAGAQGLGLHPKLDLYRMSGQPGATPQSLDTRAYAVHGDAGNTFTGLGIKEGGLDRRNAADNARAMAVARLNEAGATARNNANIAGQDRRHFGLVTAPKDSTVIMAPDIAKLYNMPQTIVGTTDVRPGETVVRQTPNAAPGVTERIDGPPPVLTTDQTFARDLAGMSVEDRLRILLSKHGMQQGPGGSISRIPNAPTPPSFQSRSVKLADGSIVTGRFDPQRGITTLEDGSPLPAGAVPFTVSVQGTSTEAITPKVRSDVDEHLKNLAMTESVLTPLMDYYTKNPALIGLPGTIRRFAQNLVAMGGDVARLFDESAKAEVVRDIQTRYTPDAVAFLTRNGFDPALPATDMLQHLLVAHVAKMYEQDGKISVYSLQQARRALGIDGAVANSQDIMSRLGVLKEQIATQRALMSQARPGTAQVFGPAPGGAPTTPPAAPAPAGAPPAAPTLPPPPPGFRPVP